MTKAYILDTETTGKDESDPIEIAYLQLSTHKPEWIDDEIGRINPASFYGVSAQYEERFMPDKPITYGAMATHHIRREDLDCCRHHTRFALPEDMTYLIGHNVDFDWKVLKSPDVKRIDTLALARVLWQDDDSHTQSACAYRINEQYASLATRNAHSALADVKVCLQVLDHICNVLNITSFEELHAVSERARIPTVISFGKHKGAAIKNVPPDYKRWYMGQADTDPYLIRAMKGEMGLTADDIAQMAARKKTVDPTPSSVRQDSNPTADLF